ncbi:YceI family protein [Mycolicibacterium sp. 018/SC-01/001]|uniref:YceI family protein n=1 Tax=Mycolicibacterium sp. 018/SC-01/001 TaxID=2592069 RepID=UPI00118050CC|nr:YceI family protein [Mycolicibacterium sp. 018/SC-01/001]TRW86151.1 YceI family protein [Mycolicibacterium sp. 018/SC-01/001]
MTWTLDPSHGELQITTGVTGPASAMGHRLTIAMTAWRATVTWEGDEPAAVDLTVDVDSLEVLRGDGGVKGLSGVEKALARSNALKTLDAKRFPQIRFMADHIVTAIDGGYQLNGSLEIHGTTQPRSVDLRVADQGSAWRMTCDVAVSHADFGLKPYSLMMGAVKVADVVTVSFRAEHPKG